MSNFHDLAEFLLGVKDWNIVVANAKDIIQNEEGDPAKLLLKRFSFLDQLEVKRAIEQAQEELGEM